MRSGAFRGLAGLSLANATVNGAQLEFGRMTVGGNFDFRGANVSGGITGSAFQSATVYNFSSTCANVSGFSGVWMK